MKPLTVLCIADDSAFASIEGALAATLPAVTVARGEPAEVRRSPQADALVLTSPELAEVARANGFPAPILVTAADVEDTVSSSLRTLGIRCVPASAPPAELAAALIEQLQGAGALRPEAAAQLAQTRQLLAAGRVALRLRHDINNPLAAIQAELQLIQMESSDEDLLAAVGRMLVMVRRITELTRALEGAARPAGPA